MKSLFRSPHFLYFLPLLVLLGSVNLVHAEIQVENIAIKQTENQIVATTFFFYSLESSVIEAIQNGVEIIFEETLQLEEYPKVWLMEDTTPPKLPEKTRRFQISYHEFDQNFRIINQQDQTRYISKNLQFLLQSIGKIPLRLTVHLSSLEPEKTYRISARSKIDVSSLPGLMRPYVYTPYLWSDWKLDSDWQHTPLLPSN